jgi:anti-anti-sigma regulatory factor
MHVPYSLAPGQQALAERPDVVVDLIGDLDATLVRSLDATLARIDLLGRSVEVRLKHVGAVQPAGVAALTRTAAAQRLAGLDLRLSGGGTLARALLKSSRLAVDPSCAGAARVRHVMIVRNATPERSCA